MPLAHLPRLGEGCDGTPATRQNVTGARLLAAPGMGYPLRMGPHAVFIWASYAVAGLALGWLVLGSLAAHRLVILPRLSAPTALALGTEFVTVLRLQDEVPERLHKAGERLERSLGALRESRQRSVEAQKLDHSVPHAADVRLDAGWAAFYRLLQAWVRLPAQGPGSRLEGWSPSTESGLQACYGKSPGNGAFSMDPIRRRLVRLTPGRA